MCCFFFFKQKTAYEMRISDWSSDVCSSDLCLAPIVKVVQEGIGIRHGMITTIHDVTNTQSVVDGPHKDPRRARSALLNLIPTTTGSATAIGLILDRKSVV